MIDRAANCIVYPTSDYRVGTEYFGLYDCHRILRKPRDYEGKVNRTFLLTNVLIVSRFE